jgi:hypothetical protein
VGDPGHGVDERVDVADPLLEQVADALRPVADDVERILLLEILRQDEHARLRALSAQLDGGSQPVVAVSGGHLDVDDRHYRTHVDARLRPAGPRQHVAT